jgi:serine protease Do
MRRSLFIFLIVGLIAFGFYRYQRLNNGDGNGRRVPEQYTPADGPRINPKDVQVLAALDAEYTRLTQAVVPSVVSITTSRTVLRNQPLTLYDILVRNRRPLRRPSTQTSLGSGVIVSREGHILTNHHVIANMDTIDVQLTDGRIEPAKLIGSDEQTDIAVLKIDAEKIEPLSLGDSDDVRVGQMVFAVGNPFGLQETVTQGIISAKGRRAMQDSGLEFLQTDAAVNQGNSGGPLLNLRGEIIGINSAIFSTSNDGTWLGISFAIPSNVARRALESVLKTGRIVRGYLGVSMKNFTLDGTQTAGAVITNVSPGSPAEKAGLQVGDIVRAFNKRGVSDTLALRSRVVESDVGAQVELLILRGGKEQTISARIEEAPVRPEPEEPER